MDERFPILRGITMFGHSRVLTCDAKCSKAWGINNRSRRQLSADEDDYVFLGDDELGEAPADPGTSEGGDYKPQDNSERLNKWCARECERSEIVEHGKTVSVLPWVPRHNRRIVRQVTP